jgi:hypothetical protein
MKARTSALPYLTALIVGLAIGSLVQSALMAAISACLFASA